VHTNWSCGAWTKSRRECEAQVRAQADQQRHIDSNANNATIQTKTSMPWRSDTTIASNTVVAAAARAINARVAFLHSGRGSRRHAVTA
jgi:hypothetical protein